MNRPLASLVLVVLLLAPAAAFADFNASVETGRAQAASLSQQQLDSLNSRVFSDAFITAKVIGYDPSDIAQLKADVAELKQENEQLRAQISNQPAATGAAPSSVDARVTALEISFAKLQGTLGLVVNMLTALLAKMQ
jgi:hypothetical protein